MSSNDSTKKTLIVAFLLCLVCSVVVSTAAVLFKPAQEMNKSMDRKRNILAAAGMLVEGKSVHELFEEAVTTRVIDLRTGKFADDIDAEKYDQRKAAKDPARSASLGDEEDIAKINRREDYSLVYLVNDAQGAVEKIILPIHGYGLWSTLWGFIALDHDANTILGLGFYEQGETPGLGGEVDNPRWKAGWPGKKVYRDGEVSVHLIKGTVDTASDDAPWQVDGLAGATLTSRGVTHLVQFWLGDNGFAPFLKNLKAGEA